LCVVSAAPTRLVGVAATSGTRLAAYATSQGRVLLAALSPDDLSAYLARTELRRRTHATIADADALASELDRVRHAGWSLVDQELEPGLRSIAVPVSGAPGVVAAAGIMVDAGRISLRRLRGALLPLLRTAAARMEGDLAHSADHALAATRLLAPSHSR
jgi:IclR family transcriptional regulator, pca regulon regulatory protein